jgi:hypothetical protein
MVSCAKDNDLKVFAVLGCCWDVGQYLVTDVSGQPGGHIFRGEAVQVVLLETSASKYQPASPNIPEQWKPHLHRGGGLTSWTVIFVFTEVRVSNTYDVTWLITFGAGEAGGKCTMRIRNLNLRTQVRKRGRISLHQPLTYAHPFLSLSTEYYFICLSWTQQPKENYS